MSETPTSDQITVVYSDRDVPSFESEAEEAAFWRTHRLSHDLLEKMSPVTDGSLPPPRTRPVSFRLDDHTIARAKSLAAARGIGYQTMLKQFINERLYEEEKREGMTG
jgi:predicted DNA binding CopG/RHH family protein